MQHDEKRKAYSEFRRVRGTEAALEMLREFHADTLADIRAEDEPAFLRRCRADDNVAKPMLKPDGTFDVKAIYAKFNANGPFRPQE